nr:MAG TPA: hypothetical protein [Caudoviricetes sp.]
MKISQFSQFSPLSGALRAGAVPKVVPPGTTLEVVSVKPGRATPIHMWVRIGRAPPLRLGCPVIY